MNEQEKMSLVRRSLAARDVKTLLDLRDDIDDALENAEDEDEKNYIRFIAGEVGRKLAPYYRMAYEQMPMSDEDFKRELGEGVDG